MAYRTDMYGNKIWVPEVTTEQTQIYNALGGGDSQPQDDRGFLERRWDSIKNAVGTTLAAPISWAKDAIQNQKSSITNATNKNKLNDIAKKYGYNSFNDVYEARDAAEAAGDTATLEKIDNIIAPELRNQANANAEKVNKNAADYRDYAENSAISKAINQDRGKFAGSAINTLSTAFDVMAPGAGVLANSVQGGIEGVADELEQNGLENFDWDRAKQNAFIGATTGAVVGGFNKGLNNVVAKRASKAVSSQAPSALRQIGSGVVRGAASGAVGGATGGGLSAALNDQNIGEGIIQGAQKGAAQGAVAGGIVTGANLAANATPGVKNVMQNLNTVQEDWRNSGDNFNERLNNTLNSGDSVVGNEIAINRLAKGIKRGTDGDIRFVDMSEDVFNDINNIRAQNGLEPITQRQVTAYKNTVNNNLGNRLDEGLTAKEVARVAFNSLTSENARAIPGYYENQIAVSQPGIRNDYDSSVIGLAEDGGTSLKSIEPRSRRQVSMFESQGQQKIGPKSQSGFSPTGENSQSTSDSNIPQSRQNVNTPETEVYRTLTNDGQNRSNLMYGESELGNRTRRGMVADSLERFGNTLEGAQTNVTRAAAKDLGIESTGKVVENVRKKTGITNLETQAQLAKEITGGADSLMDSIQRQALSASEDGRGYKVDTTPVQREIGNIVDKYADTNMFGSLTAREKFVSNLRRDIASADSDILSISNRMKANAADLRGRGVASPTPADSAKAKIYTEIAGKLDDLSYKAIPQDNVDAMFDATITEMRGRANQAAQNGNNDIARAYNKMAASLESEPRTVKAYRSFKKDFVDASKIADLTAQAENGAAVQMGRGFGSGIKRFTGTVLQRPVNTALAKIGGGVNSVADRISGTGTALPVAGTEAVIDPSATRLYNAIGRTEGLSNAEQARTANYLSDAVQEAQVVPTGNTLESLVSPQGATSNSVYNAMNNGYQTTTTNTGYFQPTGDYWTDILAAAMTSAINANDVTAFGSLYAMYQDALSKLNSSETTSNQTKLTATQQRANAAMNSLERLSGMTPDVGYNLSNIPLVGSIATFGGNNYEAEAKSLAQQIGYMVSGANIKESEAEAIGKAYVPQPFDTEDIRKAKLQRAYEIITQYQNGVAE